MNLHTDIVTSVVRSVEPERTQQVNQRTAGFAQDQIAAQSVVQAKQKKVAASNKAQESKIKKDRDSEGGSEGGEGGSYGQAYSPEGRTDNIGDESEGHVIDALA